MDKDLKSDLSTLFMIRAKYEMADVKDTYWEGRRKKPPRASSFEAHC